MSIQKLYHLGVVFFITGAVLFYARPGTSAPKVLKELPGNCVIRGWSANSNVAVYQDRSAKVVAFHLNKGDKVGGLACVEEVTRFGRCVAKEATTLTRLKGGDLALRKGEALSIYTMSEGDVFGTFQGLDVIAEAEELDCNPYPESKSWLKMRSQSGKTGWSNEPEKFDGASQYD